MIILLINILLLILYTSNCDTSCNMNHDVVQLLVNKYLVVDKHLVVVAVVALVLRKFPSC